MLDARRFGLSLLLSLLLLPGGASAHFCLMSATNAAGFGGEAACCVARSSAENQTPAATAKRCRSSCCSRHGGAPAPRDPANARVERVSDDCPRCVAVSIPVGAAVSSKRSAEAVDHLLALSIDASSAAVADQAPPVARAAPLVIAAARAWRARASPASSALVPLRV